MRALHDLLNSETALLQGRLESLPFFRALHTGSLPPPAIVSLLRCLSIIHAVLEGCLCRISDAPVAALGQHATPKIPLLEADLESLGAAQGPSLTTAIRSALDYGAEILASASDPLNLVGALYVLEGSQNGGLLLKQAYARCLGVPPDRLSYFGCYGNGTATHWDSFGALLDALAIPPAAATQLVQYAVRGFERLEGIFAALYPYRESDLKYHVAAVNFEAGDHAIPQSPIEIELALRTGRAAWERYPYLAHRFGERGRRFTSSDSCWLVNLARMPVDTATRSLEWLRAVLASRGIPTVILESHLRAISAAMTAQCPDHAELCARYEPFLMGRQAERRALCSVESLPPLIGEFEQRFRACDGLTIECAAELIVSAWIDEHCDISGALAAVRDWFLAPDRFSAHWIANVDELLARLGPGSPTAC